MGKKKSGFLKEFKEFAMKGNMLDLAVGVIVGGAFKTVVDALTNSVIMPVVSMFLGGLSFEEWKIRLPQFFGEKLDENGEVIVNYLRFGDFLSAFINFVIMAFVVFLIVKTVNRLREAGEKHRKKEAEAPAAPPEPTKEEQLLTEIRDLLKSEPKGAPDMKRICILCLLAALLLGACGQADAPYMEPVRTYCAALQDGDFTRLQEAIPPAVLNADGFDAGELANVRDSFAKGSNDYDITPKELDSRRIPESGCRVLEDYFRQQYDWTMTVDEARLVKFRVSFTGELDGQLNVRAVCYQTGGHWYLDLSAVSLNLFS
ncbi:MAG: large-conductance mechanosensitive channel protein MscL [Oscillospiraceae bacterium]